MDENINKSYLNVSQYWPQVDVGSVVGVIKLRNVTKNNLKIKHKLETKR